MGFVLGSVDSEAQEGVLCKSLGGGVPLGCWNPYTIRDDCYNYGQKKMEELTPFPPPKKSNDKGAKEQQHTISASLKWGLGGMVQMFHLFCPRLYLD